MSRAVASSSSSRAVASALRIILRPSTVKCRLIARPSVGCGLRSSRPRLSRSTTRFTRFGGRIPSVEHSCLEVIPALCHTNDNSEKSAGPRSYTAIRSRKTSMIASAARRALYPSRNSRNVVSTAVSLPCESVVWRLKVRVWRGIENYGALCCVEARNFAPKSSSAATLLRAMLRSAITAAAY